VNSDAVNQLTFNMLDRKKNVIMAILHDPFRRNLVYSDFYKAQLYILLFAGFFYTSVGQNPE